MPRKNRLLLLRAAIDHSILLHRTIAVAIALMALGLSMLTISSQWAVEDTVSITLALLCIYLITVAARHNDN